jgi:hypothetical protein
MFAQITDRPHSSLFFLLPTEIRVSFLQNKDIAPQKPFSSIEAQLLSVVSACGIGADEK